MTRRHWFRRIFGIGLIAFSAGLLKRIFWPSALGEADLPTLTAFVDTLIPADDGSPAASTLAVDTDLLVRINADRQYRYLMHEGLGWLHDEAVAERFEHADTVEQERLLHLAQAQPVDTPAGAMFWRVRDDVMDLYYSDPRTWTALGFAGPPQPVGFPDFDQAANRHG